MRWSRRAPPARVARAWHESTAPRRPAGREYAPRRWRGRARCRVRRGDLVESVHDVAVVAVAAGGGVTAATDGAAELSVFLRSAAKPFQAAPAVAAGVLERFGLDDRHLALACASHVATPEHVALAAELLAAAGLDESALRCGPGDDGRPLSHACSGNHGLGLALCVQEGWPTATYLEPVPSAPGRPIRFGDSSELAGARPRRRPATAAACGPTASRSSRYAAMFGALGDGGRRARPVCRQRCARIRTGARRGRDRHRVDAGRGRTRREGRRRGDDRHRPGRRARPGAEGARRAWRAMEPAAVHAARVAFGLEPTATVWRVTRRHRS